MPDWARAALEPGPVRLLDIVLEVCRTFGWSVDDVLSTPVRRFWRVVGYIRRRNEERAEAARDNPIGALAMASGER